MNEKPNRKTPYKNDKKFLALPKIFIICWPYIKNADLGY